MYFPCLIEDDVVSIVGVDLVSVAAGFVGYAVATFADIVVVVPIVSHLISVVVKVDGAIAVSAELSSAVLVIVGC